jgi:hypothetical protein
MAKLDRLGWAGGLSFAAYGLRLGVRTNAVEFLPRLEAAIPPSWPRTIGPEVDWLYSVTVGGAGTRPGVRRYSLLYRGIVRLARTMDADELLDAFDADLRLTVAEFAHRRVFVHAGVVGWNGQAVVLPGRTHTGKSTLVAELLRAGATYYSDEYAVLDARGRVYPYAEPLSLRRPHGARPRKVTAEELGAPPGTAPLPIGMVLVTQYKPGATWRPRSLSPGNGLLALLANTVPARRKPRLVLKSLRNAIADAKIVKSSRSEATAIVAYLYNSLGQPNARRP